MENGSVDAAVAWVRYAKQEKLGITHWCLGNEVYYDEQLKKPQNYVACIQKFAQARKRANPSIKIGMDYLSHNDDGSTYRSVTPAPAVTVRIAESVNDAAGPAFRYNFPAHSITVIELLARQEGK